jgi:hypothetical protein
MNQFEPPNPIAAFLADVWIDAARHYGGPMTYEQEQLARQECARFSESQGFPGDCFWPTRPGAYDPLRPNQLCVPESSLNQLGFSPIQIGSGTRK